MVEISHFVDDYQTFRPAKRISRNFSDSIPIQPKPSKTDGLPELQKLVQSLAFTLDHSPGCIKQTCYELSNKLKEILKFPNAFIDQTGLIQVISRVLVIRDDHATIDIILDGFTHLLSKSFYAQSVFGASNPESICLDLLVSPLPTVRRSICHLINALCQTPDGAYFVTRNSLFARLIEMMRDLMSEFPNESEVSEVAFGLFHDLIVILQSIALHLIPDVESDLGPSFVDLLPHYFDVIRSTLAWGHGTRFRSDVLNTLVFIASLKYERRIIGECWLFDELAQLMADPVNRPCFRSIFALYTQLLMCEDWDVEWSSVIPTPLVDHCINLYVSPEFHEDDYIDFFINYVMLGNEMLANILQSDSLLEFCCEQVKKGTITVQRGVRHLFWVMLYVAMVNQMDLILPVIGDYLVDSFDDDNKQFLFCVLTSINAVLRRISTCHLVQHEMYQMFMCEMIPHIKALAIDDWSDTIARLASDILHTHADLAAACL
jgi:hypothetical protein